MQVKHFTFVQNWNLMFNQRYSEIYLLTNLKSIGFIFGIV